MKNWSFRELAVFPVLVSSAIQRTAFFQRGIVFEDGGDEIVGNYETLCRESDSAAVVFAEVAVVLDRHSLAPAEPNMPEKFERFYPEMEYRYRAGIQQEFFTHFKTNNKAISIYRLLRCCVL